MVPRRLRVQASWDLKGTINLCLTTVSRITKLPSFSYFLASNNIYVNKCEWTEMWEVLMYQKAFCVRPSCQSSTEHKSWLVMAYKCINFLSHSFLLVQELLDCAYYIGSGVNSKSSTKSTGAGCFGGGLSRGVWFDFYYYYSKPARTSCCLQILRDKANQHSNPCRKFTLPW